MSTLLRHSLLPCHMETLTLNLSRKLHFGSPLNIKISKRSSVGWDRKVATRSGYRLAGATEDASPLSEEAMMGFISGKKKATEVAHLVWKNIIRKGDTVVDATCGNGHDTLALLKMVADESGRGSIYGMDIQNSALENTSCLLDESANPNEKKLVKLFSLCHSKMEDVIPNNTSVRLVAFNLGYLPGGDKAVITTSQTTLLALQAASRILDSGGLISVVVYVGHPGGRKEFETVQTFVSGLSTESWVSCKFEMLNRPCSPILVLAFKK